MNSKPINKYLEVYAEKEVKLLSNCLHQFSINNYRHAILVPAYLENSAFLARLQNQLPSSEGKVLLVLASNHPTGLSELDKSKAIESHDQLTQFLGDSNWVSSSLSHYKNQPFDTLLINRTSDNAIPIKQGVGLARKIAADLITLLITKGIIESHWIMSTDADAALPKDYFKISPSKKDVAIVYNFKHSNVNDEISKATLLYERSIRHYVTGLEYAQSDYAFSTLGSCIAIKVDAYSKVRGFPKRPAGEDFYLLNKLAKIGTINSVNTPTINIESRISNRVPFGTGPAVEKITSSSNTENLALFYEPEIFVQLREVLRVLWSKPSSLNEIHLSQTTIDALTFLDIEQAFEHSDKQNLKLEQYQHHIKTWFDGFKTLKFVHYLRDHGYPMLSEVQLNELTFFQG